MGKNVEALAVLQAEKQKPKERLSKEVIFRKLGAVAHDLATLPNAISVSRPIINKWLMGRFRKGKPMATGYAVNALGDSVDGNLSRAGDKDFEIEKVNEILEKLRCRTSKSGAILDVTGDFLASEQTIKALGDRGAIPMPLVFVAKWQKRANAALGVGGQVRGADMRVGMLGKVSEAMKQFGYGFAINGAEKGDNRQRLFGAGLIAGGVAVSTAATVEYARDWINHEQDPEFSSSRVIGRIKDRFAGFVEENRDSPNLISARMGDAVVYHLGPIEAGPSNGPFLSEYDNGDWGYVAPVETDEINGLVSIVLRDSHAELSFGNVHDDLPGFETTVTDVTSLSLIEQEAKRLAIDS